MDIPHAFPSLLDPQQAPPVLLIGAGMSFDIAPSVATLAKEISNRHVDVIQILGIDPSPPPTDEKDIYDWAERAFSKLTEELGLSAPDAKLRLATGMGITYDPRFRAKIGMPLRGNTPRHRVVARFVREGRWKSIWSLNWDCILETALESVGLSQQPDPQNPPANPLPWKKWYCTWTPGDHHSPADSKDTLHVIKPHGCVNKLANGNSLFIVTRTELNNLTKDLQPSLRPFRVNLSDSPLVVVGWSATENYIHDNIQAIQQHGALANTQDRLSVVDPFWAPPHPCADDTNHNRLANSFTTQRVDCHFATNIKSYPSTDDLFQWLQTRFGLRVIQKWAESKNWTIQAQQILQLVADCSALDIEHCHIHSLFDDFLSVWVRLCFNSYCVSYNHYGQIQPEMVATHLRDEHIPWSFSYTDRFDLLAAIPLVLAITQSGKQWGFSQFPGALWNSHDGHLVLPLPAWDKTGQVSSGQAIELAALKPQMECWNWSQKGAINRLSILPLLPQQTFEPVTDSTLALRNSVAWLMKATQFAIAENIDVVSLADV